MQNTIEKLQERKRELKKMLPSGSCNNNIIVKRAPLTLTGACGDANVFYRKKTCMAAPWTPQTTLPIIGLPLRSVVRVQMKGILQPVCWTTGMLNIFDFAYILVEKFNFKDITERFFKFEGKYLALFKSQKNAKSII